MAEAGGREPEAGLQEFGSGKPAGVPGIAVMACRAFKIQLKADTRSAGAGCNDGPEGESREPDAGSGFRGRNPI
jgi:hypothetical protein